LNPPFFKTRGVVLSANELTTVDWPTRAKNAGLTTIGIHISPSQIADFIKSDEDQAFLEQCDCLGIIVEHELHAMRDLLPRDLFHKDTTLFRMNEQGQRVPDFNCCAHSQEAIEVICQNAVSYAEILKPSTGRYFYWIDDAQPMCRCPKCRAFSDSEQALILENEMLSALRRVDARATLAHLAYQNTLSAPKQVTPREGIFLEFAPIHRSWEETIGHREAGGKRSHGEYLDLLDANLAVFGAETAQILEYWLDASRFSNWQRPAKKLPWRYDVFIEDVAVYGGRGIRNITTFAVFVDADYIERFGEPPLEAYGGGLLQFRPT